MKMVRLAKAWLVVTPILSLLLYGFTMFLPYGFDGNEASGWIRFFGYILAGSCALQFLIGLWVTFFRKDEHSSL